MALRKLPYTDQLSFRRIWLTVIENKSDRKLSVALSQ